MGTTSMIIVSNGIETKSFYVGIDSHDDVLGKRLKEMLSEIDADNWQEVLINKLKEKSKYQLLQETIPINYVYLINMDKQVIYMNYDDWTEMN